MPSTRRKSSGLTRHIGISNFTVSQVGEAVELSDAPLICNQIEYHPLINQTNLIAACRAHGLAITAYCPIARNRVADEPVMQEIAAHHGATPSDITLAWHMAQGDVMAIPRSSKPERLASNLAASEINLSADEMMAINALKAQHTRCATRPAWRRSGINREWMLEVAAYAALP
jgi:2,5-diketo-D-gluconate reductase B